jgi:hypothetical protein
VKGKTTLGFREEERKGNGQIGRERRGEVETTAARAGAGGQGGGLKVSFACISGVL